MQKYNQSSIPTEWDDFLSKGVREWKGKNLRAVICKLAWGSAVYNLWRFRSDVKFWNQTISEEKMLQKICREVRTRIMWNGNFKGNQENYGHFCKLG
jgi:hypothetical protein